MQHLLKKINYYNSPFHASEAWSPFENYRKDVDNKRSKLFPDRKRIPGRKTKYILCIVYLIHIYTVSKFLQQKRIYNNKAEQQRQMSRKLSPFFQSIEDIHYTTLKHRQDLIMIEAFKPLGGAAYLEKFKRFTNPDFFQANGSIGGHPVWQKAGTGRTNRTYSDYVNNQYKSGYDIQNI